MIRFLASPLRRTWAVVLVGSVGLPFPGASIPAQAQDFRIQRVWLDPQGQVCLGFEAVTNDYYILDRTRALPAVPAPVALVLGETSPTSLEDSVQSGSVAFYRLRRVSVAEPLDVDGDGMNDVYELRHPSLLDPLNPEDAAEDPDHDGRSNLAECQTGSDPGGTDVALVVYVVDQPVAGDRVEFRELTEALDYLQTRLEPTDLGKVIIETERPLPVDSLTLDAHIGIEAAEAYRGKATIAGPGTTPLVVTSEGILSLAGLRFLNLGGLIFNAGGYLRLSGNALPATQVSFGGSTGPGPKDQAVGPRPVPQSSDGPLVTTQPKVSSKGGTSTPTRTPVFRKDGAGGGAANGEVSDNAISGPLQVQFAKSFSASSSFGFSGNTAESLTIGGGLRFDGQVAVHANVTPSLTLGWAFWGDAQVEFAEHTGLNEFRVSGSLEGNPTLTIRNNAATGFALGLEGVGSLGLILQQNSFQQAQLNLGGARHDVQGEDLHCGNLAVDLTRTASGEPQQVQCRMNNLSVDYGLTWNAVQSENARLDVSLNNLKANGDFTLNTKAEGRIELGEGSFVKGTASVTVLGNLTELRSPQVTYEGALRLEVGGVEAGLTLQAGQDHFNGDVSALLGSPGVFVQIDLSKVMWGPNRTFHAACPGGRPKSLDGLMAKPGRRTPLRHPKANGEAIISMTDVTAGPSQFAVDALDLPVRLERCRFGGGTNWNAIDLTYLTGDVTIRDCDVEDGNLNLRQSTSAVTVENSRFDVTALGQAALSVHTRSATVRNNEIKATSPAPGGISLEVQDTAMLEGNTVEAGAALGAWGGKVGMVRNTLTGTVGFDEAEVLANGNTFNGMVNINAAGTASAPTFGTNVFNGYLNVTGGRVMAQGNTVNGFIWISGGGVLALEENNLAGAFIVDANESGGLTQNPVLQGALPDQVNSWVDFDQDPLHCADYPVQFKDDGTCVRPGVPPPQ